MKGECKKSKVNKIKVILFGMTGFGNNALGTLIKQPFVKVIGVFTPRRKNAPFPYYECEKIEDLAENSRIVFYKGLMLKKWMTYQLIKKLSPDLIVVSSFDQIIPKSIISIPKFGIINVHPSLLPKYRGATPTVWTLMNGERETGITIHFIDDEEIDRGRIILQKGLEIVDLDTDGKLRQKLAILSETALKEALTLVLRKNKKIFPIQDESEATYYPKCTEKDADIRLDKPFKETRNKIRAVSPYPGAYLKYDGKKYIVGDVVLLKEKDYKKVKSEELVVKTSQGLLKFRIVKENHSAE